LNGRWVPHDTRDQVVDYINRWTKRAELPARRLLGWLGLGTSKFHQWRNRYGMANEHNGRLPRDWWLEDWEKQAIVEYCDRHPLEGYRRLTFMMLDDDVVAVSPSSTYRVLKAAGRLDRQRWAPSKKGTGFVQPDGPHKHWHIDISHLNLAGTFYFLITVLDGYSRYIVHWEIRETMKELDTEIVVQRAVEKYPRETPRIISDNGPQFVARDFKDFIRLMGLTHVRTSPYYPQSNGKLERWHASIKRECIRPAAPASLDEALRLVSSYVDTYNHSRLHSALGYITPADKLNGLEQLIFAKRDRKLEEARQRRQQARQAMPEVA
jgi:transposase InsO family protein